MAKLLFRFTRSQLDSIRFAIQLQHPPTCPRQEIREARSTCEQALGELAACGRLAPSLNHMHQLIGYLMIGALGRWCIPRQVSYYMVERWVQELAPAVLAEQQQREAQA